MKLDRAILLKESYLRNPLCNLNSEEIKADLLSIQALKGYQSGRALPGGQFFHDLPGETEE